MTDSSTVQIAGSDDSFDCAPDDYILDAAFAAGLRLPHNCRGGACGECKCRLLAGTVSEGFLPGFGITDEEKADGKILICISKPASDRLVIEPLAASETPADAPAPCSWETTVVAAEKVSQSVLRLVLALPDRAEFRFEPGASMTLAMPGVAPDRSYSIAAPPAPDSRAADGLLPFFVSRHRDGRVSGWLHQAMRPGARVSVAGPFGGVALPAGHAGPVLALAGGTGLSPLLSLLESRLGQGYDAPIRLVFSVRGPDHVFALDRLTALARRHANFDYTTTATRARDGLPPGWRAGRVQDWLAAEAIDWSATAVIAAGAPGFVAACRALALDAGTPAERIVEDAFVTASPAAPALDRAV